MYMLHWKVFAGHNVSGSTDLRVNIQKYCKFIENIMVSYPGEIVWKFTSNNSMHDFAHELKNPNIQYLTQATLIFHTVSLTDACSMDYFNRQIRYLVEFY